MTMEEGEAAAHAELLAACLIAEMFGSLLLLCLYSARLAGEMTSSMSQMRLRTCRKG